MAIVGRNTDVAERREALEDAFVMSAAVPAHEAATEELDDASAVRRTRGRAVNVELELGAAHVSEYDALLRL